ncbi:ATP-binding cassette domain-containing protein [Lagierella sp.]|uniref:ABC transporter ATP-binding protein n=1 Tax=Lagierella sp. TaxID=2849657 RepID=UPI0026279278|nr:ATP-binding cassette domain-containing protein [Lagierella sp.]
MINLNLIEKKYDEKVILKDISLRINPMDILVIKGESGVGKTTLLRIMSGLDRDFKGTIKNTFRKQSISFSQKVFLGRLSAFDEVKVLSKAEDPIIKSSLKYFDLYKCKDNLAKNLSTGQKTRLSLIRALLTRSEIVYLDEPFLGLDLYNKEKAIDFIKENLNNRTLIYTGDELGFNKEQIYEL